jgi:RND superfamily putative drug exporter
MGRISQWAVRKPWLALGTWIALMAAIIVLSIQFGGEYNDDFELPNTESTKAQELLGELSGSAGTGAGLEGQVVWSSDEGSVSADTVQEAMTPVLTEVSESEGVLCVVSPYGEPIGAPVSIGSECPDEQAQQGGQESGEGEEPPPAEEPAEPPSEAAAGALAHFGQSGISPDDTVAYATVIFAGATFDEQQDRFGSVVQENRAEWEQKIAAGCSSIVVGRGGIGHN